MGIEYGMHQMSNISVHGGLVFTAADRSATGVVTLAHAFGGDRCDFETEIGVLRYLDGLAR